MYFSSKTYFLIAASESAAVAIPVPWKPKLRYLISSSMTLIKGDGTNQRSLIFAIIDSHSAVISFFTASITSSKLPHDVKRECSTRSTAFG